MSRLFIRLAEQFGYKWQAPMKGDIYLTNLHGEHQVIVISDNAYNEDSKHVYAIPLTTKRHSDHIGIRLTPEDGVSKTVYAKLDEITAVRKIDLGNFVRPVTKETLSMLEEYVRDMFFGPKIKKPMPRRKK
jgi:mRNA-degrading endonuclease toxin of MazEF toxin-antitoxin module